jgi:hypothetical protein
MFLQAGFNGRCRARGIAFARVSRLDRHWVRSAELIQFASGDFAWYGRGGISWGEQLVICNFIQAPACDRPREALTS